MLIQVYDLASIRVPCVIHSLMQPLNDIAGTLYSLGAWFTLIFSPHTAHNYGCLHYFIWPLPQLRRLFIPHSVHGQ